MISVVIPVYNMTDLVGASVASALAAADGEELEVIVVDDGSDDPDAVRAAVAGERSRVICQERQGVAAARNRGIREARGDLIAFLDADDRWTNGFLPAVRALLQDYPDAALYATSYEYVLPDGGVRRPRLHGLPRGFERGLLPRYFEAAVRSDPLFCSSAVVVRRAALAAIGGFPAGVRVGEDLLTWARLVVHGGVAYDRGAHVRYRLAPRADGRPARFPDADDAVSRGLAELLAAAAPGLQSGLRRYASLWHRMRANVYMGFGEKACAREEVRAALRLTPGSPRLWAYLVVLALPAAGPLSASAMLACVRRWRRHLSS